MDIEQARRIVGMRTTKGLIKDVDKLSKTMSLNSPSQGLHLQASKLILAHIEKHRS